MRFSASLRSRVAWNRLSSVARFPLMAHREDDDFVLVNAVKRHIAAVAEVDQPFTVLDRHAIHRATDMGLLTQKSRGIADGVPCSPGCRRILWPQEFPQPLEIPQCPWREPYFRHSGAGCSSSLPQLASQASTSSAVACKPVSWYSRHASRPA